jgi:magnesium chelatase family protein
MKREERRGNHDYVVFCLVFLPLSSLSLSFLFILPLSLFYLLFIPLPYTGLMSIAKVYSAQLVGLQSEIVTIEVDISHGLHAFAVVGLGDRAIEESRDRISAAIKNSGYVSPKQKNQKVVISLAPADVRKEGPSFDLAMAVAYLKAVGEVDFASERMLFLGELSLEGSVRKVSGLLPILCQAPTQGYTHAIVPLENMHEASLAQGITIVGVTSLQETLYHLGGHSLLPPIIPRDVIDQTVPSTELDMNVIRGNESAKRGLEIAAAGAHNVLMWGPPGTGKTMLAQSFPSLLPPLSYEQAVEVTGIHSAARILKTDLVVYPPFRSPHHTASYPSIVGGGSFPKPGEITLAHRGVLFLDEFPEFDRAVLEALRQPLEDRTITISRAKGTVKFPAQCILIASMNPCPCGKGRDHGCTCLSHALLAYQRRISGPIMDRIDVYLQVHKVDYEKMAAASVSSESSSDIRARVVQARTRQQHRFARHGITKVYNSEMSAPDIERCVTISAEARALLAASAQKLDLSGRAFHRVIKVAQTIADLAGVEKVEKQFILEALQYRKQE